MNEFQVMAQFMRLILLLVSALAGVEISEETRMRPGVDFRWLVASIRSFWSAILVPIRKFVV
jgi:hypothetical protein